MMSSWTLLYLYFSLRGLLSKTRSQLLETSEILLLFNTHKNLDWKKFEEMEKSPRQVQARNHSDRYVFWNHTYTVDISSATFAGELLKWLQSSYMSKWLSSKIIALWVGTAGTLARDISSEEGEQGVLGQFNFFLLLGGPLPIISFFTLLMWSPAVNSLLSCSRVDFFLRGISFFCLENPTLLRQFSVN